MINQLATTTTTTTKQWRAISCIAVESGVINGLNVI